MSFEHLRALLDARLSDEQALDLERKNARCAWVTETVAKAWAAQRHMDEVCTAAANHLDEEEFQELFEEEQAKVDAYLTPLREAAEEDKWPKELYFGGI